MATPRKLEVAHQSLTRQAKQGKVEAFLNNVGNAGTLGGLLEDIRDAVVEYQVRISFNYSFLWYEVRSRRHCNKISTTKAVGSS